MTSRAYIAPIGIISSLWRAPQFDEHCKAWRWHRFAMHSAYSLHVQDYYVQKHREAPHAS